MIDAADIVDGVVPRVSGSYALTGVNNQRKLLSPVTFSERVPCPRQGGVRSQGLLPQFAQCVQ